ncbi:hypothetical protein B5X24_HaOG210896 [Helicoverpa armigera]|uniref:Uncharacterized protein n=1 Tax=Helicoverpa armigera TaxID=29058 RepID=A0A2W1BIL4_HELAM|nr:hypothetical protein B5X24_HaOG210896 [Helicoverpa armigera]
MVGRKRHVAPTPNDLGTGQEDDDDDYTTSRKLFCQTASKRPLTQHFYQDTTTRRCQVYKFNYLEAIIEGA